MDQIVLFAHIELHGVSHVDKSKIALFNNDKYVQDYVGFLSSKPESK